MIDYDIFIIEDGQPEELIHELFQLYYRLPENTLCWESECNEELERLADITGDDDEFFNSKYEEAEYDFLLYLTRDMFEKGMLSMGNYVIAVEKQEGIYTNIIAIAGFMPEGERMYISDIEVNKQFIGKGFCTKLLRRLLEHIFQTHREAFLANDGGEAGRHCYAAMSKYGIHTVEESPEEFHYYSE